MKLTEKTSLQVKHQLKSIIGNATKETDVSFTFQRNPDYQGSVPDVLPFQVLTSISLVGLVQCMLLNIITDKTDETFILLNFFLLPCATIHRSNCY